MDFKNYLRNNMIFFRLRRFKGSQAGKEKYNYSSTLVIKVPRLFSYLIPPVSV